MILLLLWILLTVSKHHCTLKWLLGTFWLMLCYLSLIIQRILQKCSNIILKIWFLRIETERIVNLIRRSIWLNIKICMRLWLKHLLEILENFGRQLLGLSHSLLLQYLSHLMTHLTKLLRTIADSWHCWLHTCTLSI